MVIAELLAGKAVDVAFAGLGSLGRRFLESGSLVTRMAVLIQADFEAGLDESYEFFEWHRDARISQQLTSLTDGAAPDSEFEAQLAKLLGDRMIRTTSPARNEIAARMASQIVRVYPLAMNVHQHAIANARKQDQLAATLKGVFATEAQAGGANTDAELAAALLSGPLEYTGVRELSEQVDRLLEVPDHLGAAEVCLEIAHQLEEKQFESHAESFRARAGRYFLQANCPKEARRWLVPICLREIGRSDHISESTWEALRDSGVDSTVVAALRACSMWPELRAPLEVIKSGLEASRDEMVSELLLDEYLDLCVLLAEPERVVETVSTAASASVGARLARIDALEALSRGQEADAEWDDLATQLDTTPVSDQGAVAWARRGFVLARRGEVAAARNAYQRSMARWNELGESRQAAEAFWSAAAVSSLCGIWQPSDFDRHQIARSMRADASTSALSRAFDLHRSGQNRRLRRDFVEARRYYQLARRIFRTRGVLGGYVDACRSLSELYAEIDEKADALTMAVFAGSDKDVKELADHDPAWHQDTFAASLRPSGAPWEQAASFQAVGVGGAEVSEHLANELAQPLLLAAESAIQSVAEAAHLAVAAIALQWPSASSAEAHSLLEQVATEDRPSSYAAQRESATALQYLTAVGKFEGTRALATIACGDKWQIVSVADLANFAGDRPEILKQLVSEGRNNNLGALVALAYGDGLVEQRDDALRAAFGHATERYLNTQTITRTEVGDRIHITQHLGVNLAQGAAIARYASERHGERIAAKYLAIARDDDDAEDNRVAAIDGLFNLAGHLNGALSAEVVDGLFELASSCPSPLGSTGSDHPLSRFRWRSGGRGVKAAAIDAASRFSEAGVETPGIGELIEANRESDVVSLKVAALRASGRCPTVDAKISWTDVLDDSATSVVVAAVQAAQVRAPDRLLERLPGLLGHSSVRIRSTAFWAAAALRRREMIQSRRDIEPNAVVRSLIRHWLATNPVA